MPTTSVSVDSPTLRDLAERMRRFLEENAEGLAIERAQISSLDAIEAFDIPRVLVEVWTGGDEAYATVVRRSLNEQARAFESALALPRRSTAVVIHWQL